MRQGASYTYDDGGDGPGRAAGRSTASELDTAGGAGVDTVLEETSLMMSNASRHARYIRMVSSRF